MFTTETQDSRTVPGLAEATHVDIKDLTMNRQIPLPDGVRAVVAIGANALVDAIRAAADSAN